jgi:hypothetical protein
MRPTHSSASAQPDREKTPFLLIKQHLTGYSRFLLIKQHLTGYSRSRTQMQSRVLDGVPVSLRWNPSRTRSSSLALIALILVSACNQTPTDGGNAPPPPVGNPPPPVGNPPPPPATGQCAITVKSDITIPTLAKNSSAACDYLIDGIINVKSTLTIEPGVVMKFSKDSRLWVEGGEIVAVGRPDARIVMQGFSPIQGYWGGIVFGTQAGNTRLEYVDLMDAGQTCTVIFCPQAALTGYGGGQLSLKNSSISNSYVNGAVLGDELVAFSNNRFYNNRWNGLVVDAEKVPLLDTASDYSGGSAPNGFPYVTLATGSKVAHAATWKKLNAPYKVSGYISLEDTLTLEPGITMLFGSNGEGRGATIDIDTNGSLHAIGTAASPITFTHLPGTPYWGGIIFDPYNTTTDTRFEYVQMSYGGDNDLVAHAFVELDKAKVYIANSSFLNSLHFAISCSYLSAPVLTLGPGNTFSGNAGGDVSSDCQ